MAATATHAAGVGTLVLADPQPQQQQQQDGSSSITANPTITDSVTLRLVPRRKKKKVSTCFPKVQSDGTTPHACSFLCHGGLHVCAQTPRGSFCCPPEYASWDSARCRGLLAWHPALHVFDSSAQSKPSSGSVWRAAGGRPCCFARPSVVGQQYALPLLRRGRVWPFPGHQLQQAANCSVQSDYAHTVCHVLG